MSDKKIISLLPAATEIIEALGLEKNEEQLYKSAEVLGLIPSGLEDSFSAVRQIASIFNAPEKAEILLEEIDERLNIIKHKLKFIEDKPGVAIIEWLSPLIIAGNWMPELIKIAGGKAMLGEAGKPSMERNFQDLLGQDPDIVIFAPCGFTIAQSLQLISSLIQNPDWQELNAVKNNRIYLAESKFFSRPGLAQAQAAEILAEILYPKQFIFGYEGSAWIKFNV